MEMAALKPEAGSLERKSSTASLGGTIGDSPNRDLLDLSRVVVRSEHELKRLMEKVPDFKIRAEKSSSDYRVDGATTADVDCAHAAPYPFADPVPTAMRDVDIRELGRVDINWRMLTTSRPKNRTDEDIFTRFVQLEKLQYETIKWENDEEMLRERRGGGRHPGVIPRGRSRGGALTSGAGAGGRARSSRTAVTEIRLQTCRECGEEFCAGSCKKYLYDDHARTLNPPSVDDIFKASLPANSTTYKGGTRLKSQASKAGAASGTGGPISTAKSSASTKSACPANDGTVSTSDAVEDTATAAAANSLELLVISGETKRASIKATASSNGKLKCRGVKTKLSTTTTMSGSEKHAAHKLKRGVVTKRK